VNSAVEMLRDEIAEKQHELIVDLPASPIYIYADPVRCCQVVCNLLSNAVKYTPERGRIHVSALVCPEAIELTVQDNGLGIADHHIEKIFDPFFQDNLRQTRYASGLGLGLTIAKKLVALHGGEIQAYSRGVNAGSRFAIRLPKSILRDGGSLADTCGEREESSLLEGQAPLPERKTQKVRVMIVDDDVDTARTLCKLLDMEGFETQVAHDGLMAVKLCQSFLPDVLLLDIGLPEMDGFQVARCLRSEKCGEKLKIVVISGWGTEADLRASREAGVNVHLVKPVCMDKLMPHLVPADSELTAS
jgi:CheY-like chemotaxis protein